LQLQYNIPPRDGPYSAQQYSPSNTSHVRTQTRTQNGNSPSNARDEYKTAPSEIDEAEQRAVAEALAAHSCICNICTCGKHKCPARIHVERHYPRDVASTYRSDYPRHTTFPEIVRAPPTNVFSSDEPFEGVSVTKSDYHAFPDAKPAPLLRPALRQTVGLEDEERDFKSETRDNYVQHPYSKRGASIPIHTMHMSGEPFIGISRSREAHTPFPHSRPSPSFKPMLTSAAGGEEDRDFCTTSAAGFNNKGYVARKPAIPFTSHVFDFDDEDRSFETESSKHYTAKNEFMDSCPTLYLDRKRGKEVYGHLLFHEDKKTGRYRPLDEAARSSVSTEAGNGQS